MGLFVVSLRTRWLVEEADCCCIIVEKDEELETCSGDLRTIVEVEEVTEDVECFEALTVTAITVTLLLL